MLYKYGYKNKKRNININGQNNPQQRNYKIWSNLIMGELEEANLEHAVTQTIYIVVV